MEKVPTVMGRGGCFPQDAQGEPHREDLGAHPPKGLNRGCPQQGIQQVLRPGVGDNPLSSKRRKEVKTRSVRTGGDKQAGPGCAWPAVWTSH